MRSGRPPLDRSLTGGNGSGRRLVHAELVLLIDFDDHEAFVLFDHSPSSAATRRMPGSDCPAFRSVVGAVLLIPRHVDDGIAVVGTAFASSRLWRFPTGCQFTDVSCSLSSGLAAILVGPKTGLPLDRKPRQMRGFR